MKTLVIAPNGLRDRVCAMVSACGAPLAEMGSLQSGGLRADAAPLLVILDPTLRDRMRPLIHARRAWGTRIVVAYLPPPDDQLRDVLDADMPVGILPSHFDLGDLRSLIESARAELTLPPRPIWSLNAIEGAPSTPRLWTLVALGSALLAGTFAYRSPGLAQWTPDTPPEFYLLALGLSLLAAGLFMKAGRPWAGGLQVAVVAALTAVSAPMA